MVRNTTEYARLTLSICFLLLLALPTQAQDDVEATASWDPPTYGTPVVHYILQLSTNEEAWITIATTVDTSATIEISYADAHRVRVAGVDAEGRQGPFSIPSDSYSPAINEIGAPGEPGKPVLN